jgi:hypothetical protein
MQVEVGGYHGNTLRDIRCKISSHDRAVQMVAGVLYLDMSFFVWWCVYVDRVGEIVMCLRRWTITGTLDPVRNLTGLTFLNLLSNRIGGMSVRTAV